MAEKNAQLYPLLMERRYFFLFVAVSFVILSAVTFFLCYRHHAIYTEQALKEDRATANLLSLLLDEHLKKIVSVMESYVQRPLLLQEVREKNAKKAVVHLSGLTKSNGDIESVIITDRQGTLWAAYPERPEVLGQNFAYRDWYKDISKEWKPSISDTYLRVVAEKDLAIGICVPIFNETGEAIGILQSTHRTVSLSNLIKQVLLDPGQFITVTDRKGQIIYSNEHDVRTEIMPCPFHAGMKKTIAAKNKTFIVNDREFGGRNRYISFTLIVNVGWTVFVERDKRSIFLLETIYYVQVTAIAFLLFLSIVLFLGYLRKQVTAEVLLQSNRAVLNMLSTAVEAREQLEQSSKALCESERKYHNLYNYAAVGLFETSLADAKIIACNQHYCDLAGFPTVDSAIGADVLHLYANPSDREEVKRILRGHGYITDHVLQLKNRLTGALFWAEFSARTDPSRDIAEGTIIDITGRKQAEEALKENERVKSELLTKMNESQNLAMIGSWEWNLKTNDVWWSGETYRIFGVTPQDYVPSFEANGKFIHPDDLVRYGKSFDHSLQTGEPLDQDFRLVTNDGLLKHCHAGGKSYYDNSGQPIRFVGTVMDITTRKQAEEEIKKLNTELEQTKTFAKLPSTRFLSSFTVLYCLPVFSEDLVLCPKRVCEPI